MSETEKAWKQLAIIYSTYIGCTSGFTKWPKHLRVRITKAETVLVNSGQMKKEDTTTYKRIEFREDVKCGDLKCS